MKEPSPFHRYLKFFTTDIWELEMTSLSRLRRFAVRLIKVVYIVVRGFLRDNCPLRSSALTYATLLSIVPLLAFAFALATAFGMDITPLKQFLIENAALGNEEIGTRMFQFVENIKSSTLGPPALALLVFTVISVMGNIELSFNRIWGVRKSRTIWRKFSDYLSVLIVTPLLVIAGVGIGSVLRSNLVVSHLMKFSLFQAASLTVWKALPWIFICLGFSFLYMFMPNTRVKLRAALAGGLLAGAIWQTALWGYVTFQVGFIKYAKIYGAMAQVPINLVWIYISWLIVLFGAEVAFAVQNVRTYHWEEGALAKSWAYQELVALNILDRIARAFVSGLPPLNAEELAAGINVPIRLVNRLLERMVEGGLINEIAARPHSYQPARDLSALTVKQVISGLRNSGGPATIPPYLKEAPLVIAIEERLGRALQGENLTLEDLLGKH